ncbi:hypothetical protein [Spelaeicoccus albus]|uniref:hypothetical protein n=1 Tax=Spelaeicoccus albus TaxID=1280376 RepID=UPI0015C7C1C3|nr:hypothetical protein [Spelaeicoccus albus]
MFGLSQQPDVRSPAADQRQCSRKGCREQASWALLWNNPRIHTPSRRKVWLACAEHRDWLEEYLASRALWKQTVRVDDIPGDAG